MNCLHVCACHFAELSYTTQHRTAMIIFPLVLQTSTRVQMLSIGAEVENDLEAWALMIMTILWNEPCPCQYLFKQSGNCGCFIRYNM